MKEYLFRAALHDAGRRPFTPIADVMDPAIYNATWVATLWTSIILLGRAADHSRVAAPLR